MLLLINYLLVVGIDCVNRPQDQMERVRIITSEEGSSYQQCRYMRMDALETFVLESLASQYQSPDNAPTHHVISVVSTVSVHTLTQATAYAQVPVGRGCKNQFLRIRPVIRPAFARFSSCRPGTPD